MGGGGKLLWGGKSSFPTPLYETLTYIHDCTPPQYKYREGSEKEREALYRGLSELVEGEWDMEFTVPYIAAQFGQDVQYVVKASNKSRQLRIRGTITCEATTYTGR